MVTRRDAPDQLKPVDDLRNISPVGCGPEKVYPFYWLAPRKELGMRRVWLSALYPSARAERPAGAGNIHRFPRTTGPLKFLLSILGIECRRGKVPAVHVAKIDGRYFVERGRRHLRLAAALNLEYIKVHLVQYSYASLKRQMHVLKYPGLDLVAVAQGPKGIYDYYGAPEETVDVLLKEHRVPCIDRTGEKARACSGSPGATVRPFRNGGRPEVDSDN
ncbi:MAG: hypothetical protein K6T29_01400 [Peptococcaceae bacterium]|nr:hypothetical protein [Peptococcaceae bacterium]